MREATPDAIGNHERASATPARHEQRPTALHGAARGWLAQPRSLKWQQDWFAEIVTTPESSPAPVDFESAQSLVTASATLSALERLEIYRTSYHARLIECLLDDYPVLQHALGEAEFERLCRAYIARFPSRSPSLNSFGRHLPGFCRDEPLPEPAFAAELAELEWAIVLSIHAPTAPVLTLDALAQVPLERWPEARLDANPSLKILRFEYPVNAYLQAYRQGTAAVFGAPRSHAVAVYRTGRSVWRLELSEAWVTLIESLASGASLSNSLAQVEPLLGELSEVEAARLVMGWFQTSVSSGLFSAVRAG